MLVDTVLKQVDKDREKGFLDAVNLAEQFWEKGDLGKRTTIK